jgi:hypothetical protein
MNPICGKAPGLYERVEKAKLHQCFEAENWDETVKVKSGFFAPLIAFFRILFNRLPVITRSKFWFYFFF